MYKPLLITASLLSLIYAPLNAQCNLICNNSIQVSLDEDCIVPLTIEHLLEGDTAGICPNGYLVIEAKFDNVWEPAIFNKNHNGQAIQVRVRDTVSGTSCSGYAALEDKTNPTITCVNDTLPLINIQDTASFLIINLETFPIIDDNCEVYATTYVDTFWTLPVSGMYDAKICRTWRVSDYSGNYATCQQTLLFEEVSYVGSTTPSNSNQFSLQVFPNPSRGIVNIDTDVKHLKSISLYSMQGTLIHQWKGVQQSLLIDLSDVPNATYFLVVKNEDGNLARAKLVLLR